VRAEAALTLESCQEMCAFICRKSLAEVLRPTHWQSVAAIGGGWARA